MCGIAGFHWASDTAKQQQLLQKMAYGLRHRGPDGEGFFQDGPIGLAHTRLSIIDLEGGTQPLFNEERSIAVVFNGEIYNYQSLRKTLLRKRHQFKTRSDTEVLVHAYESYGEDFLDMLDGPFALALWDRRKATLLLARDPFGEKPLYYTSPTPQTLFFTSELRPLLTAHSGNTPSLNPDALLHFLSLQFVPEPHSIFQGIHKLESASFLRWTAQGLSEPHRYTTFVPGNRILRDDENAERVRHLLSASVKSRLVSDVPVGLFLSGGLDSTLAASLAATHATFPLHSFTLRFNEAAFDEGTIAAQTAQRLGLHHHELFLDLEQAKQTLHTFLATFDEPLADPSAFPLSLLCQEARKTVKTVLTGDGGDEIFAGYQRYQLDRWINKLQGTPDLLFRTVGRLFARARLNPNARLGEEPLLALKRFPRLREIAPSASLYRWGSYFSPSELSLLFKRERSASLSFTLSEALLTRLFNEPEETDSLNRTLYADLRCYAPGDYLAKSDRMGMAHGLETRTPYLQKELVAFLFSLSGSQKAPPLKKILKNSFPEQLTSHQKKGPKRGFTVPIAQWMREGLETQVLDLCQSQGSLSTEWFQMNTIEQLVDCHKKRLQDHSKKLYALFCLEAWYQAIKRSDKTF